MNIFKVIFPIFLLIVIGCAEEEANIPNPVEVESPSISTATGEEDYLNEKSDVIFDQNELHTFELTLSPENLNKINADPAAEEYVEGKLTFNGETLEQVGIRYKGSIGAFVGCLTGRDWTNYWFFREMGVPAPRAVHARLLINGEFSGVYALVEQIDGRFTRWNFEDGTGNLYKEIWPLNSSGQAFSDSEYIDHLKTNEDENPTANLISGFANAVSNAKEEELQGVISEWMNVEEIMSYIAVDRTIRNDDGAFHWYCNGGSCAPHNFYWYEDPTEKKLHLIPWDLDNAFENIISPANPVTPIVDAWGQTSNDCQPFAAGFLGLRQRSSACDKLTGGWASFTEVFDRKKEEFTQGPLSDEVVDNLITTWQEQIRAATIEAELDHPDAITVDQWEHSVTTLKSALQFARFQ